MDIDGHGKCFINPDILYERLDASNKKYTVRRQYQAFHLWFTETGTYRNCSFTTNIHVQCNGSNMYGYIYIDKTIYHLSLRVARLNPMCYLAGVLISKSKCCLWIPRGCSQGGWGRMEGEGSDSDVPPSISQSCCDGDNAKSTDGISAVPQIGSKHAASHLHHPSSQMKNKGENGQWVMEIDSKET